MFIVEREQLQSLFDALIRRGYALIGPTVRDSAIAYDEIKSVDDLPVGWTDEQDAGRYRLNRRSDQAMFAYAVGPHSWKRYLHPPSIRFWQAKRNGRGFNIHEEERKNSPFAFIGVRPCDLRAIEILDTVFTGREFVDASYESRRRDAFIVAVNCIYPASTCFCSSMLTGPRATGGFDLCLTEILEPDHHQFTVEVGSQRGEEILQDIPRRTATEEDAETFRLLMAEAEARIRRRVHTKDMKEFLYKNYEHPQWQEIANRCLSCANCTMVCPTCFCTAVEDTTDLMGNEAERSRRWDSCFTMDFSYIHGGGIRSSTRARYRQWMTHKLASWVDQFGTPGCTGCGRCITWCPAGIDLTEEFRTMQESENNKLICEEVKTNGNT